MFSSSWSSFKSWWYCYKHPQWSKHICKKLHDKQLSVQNTQKTSNVGPPMPMQDKAQHVQDHHLLWKSCCKVLATEWRYSTSSETKQKKTSKLASVKTAFAVPGLVTLKKYNNDNCIMLMIINFLYSLLSLSALEVLHCLILWKFCTLSYFSPDFRHMRLFHQKC